MIIGELYGISTRFVGTNNVDLKLSNQSCARLLKMEMRTMGFVDAANTVYLLYWICQPNNRIVHPFLEMPKFTGQLAA